MYRLTLSVILLSLSAAAACVRVGVAASLDIDVDVAAVTWQAVSDRRQFRVVLAPRGGAPALGAHHSWIIEVRDAAGAPVYPARIDVGGGLRGRGYGLPTRPRVSEYLGAGRYLIEDMRFTIAGAWTLLFHIESRRVRDQVRLRLDVVY